jgi:hypothetical protein
VLRLANGESAAAAAAGGAGGAAELVPMYSVVGFVTLPKVRQRRRSRQQKAHWHICCELIFISFAIIVIFGILIIFFVTIIVFIFALTVLVPIVFFCQLVFVAF